jgi:hypothetical protein
MIRRALRPSLVLAAGVAAAATGYLFHAAGVVQRQLDDAGMPNCMNPNDCYPHGAAMDAVFRMELIAACVPALLGVILGVPLFARRSVADPATSVESGPARRQRGVLVTLGYTLAVGLLCTAPVATTYRLVAARYTVLANDTYELLELLHFNNVAFMMAVTATLTALAGVVGLATRRMLPTLLLTTVGWPFTVVLAAVGASLLAYPLTAMFGVTTAPVPDDTAGSFAGDISFMDPFAYTVSAALVLGATGLVLLARRLGQRPTEHQNW